MATKKKSKMRKPTKPARKKIRTAKKRNAPKKAAKKSAAPKKTAVKRKSVAKKDRPETQVRRQESWPQEARNQATNHSAWRIQG